MARLRGVDGVVPPVLADGKRGGPGGGAGRSIDMDAVKFIRERNRMCKHFRECAECPAHGVICGTIGELNDAERLVQIVEQWSAAHPRKTRQSVFLKQYPNAVLDKDGVLRICPSFVGGDTPEKYKCICLTDCSDCRREFWMQEVE
jgi:hypothetical protein